ncbi:MAG: cupin [Epibacterium sp.]|nr:cupin [Epibacterium sp.]NQX72802.1 cupin [Epibacterium sp.]
MSDARSIVTAAEIEVTEGTAKTHFKNEGARRANISLGELTGLTRLGFHIVAVQPGFESTEYQVHHHEDECTYVLAGTEVLRCIVVGQRLDHDVADYPNKGKRIFRNKGLPWTLGDHDALQELDCVVGKK